MEALKEELLKINNELNSQKITEEEAFQKGASICRLSSALIREGHKKKFEKALMSKSFKTILDIFISDEV
jgi:predicted translin family RNA/ssDNA-binding protein